MLPYVFTPLIPRVSICSSLWLGAASEDSDSMLSVISVQSLGCVCLIVTSWTAAPQASLSITNSQSLLKLMSIESVMPSSHLILCRQYVTWQAKAKSNKQKLCEFTLIWNCIWYYIFVRNLIYGEKKIQSALHICISMDPTEGWKIFEKKIPWNSKKTTLEFATHLQLFIKHLHYIWISLVIQIVENLPAVQESQVRSLGLEVPLKKGMATYSSILAWRIPWTEELGRLQSTGSQGVRHDWGTNTTTLLYQQKYWKAPSHGRITFSKPQIGISLLQVVKTTTTRKPQQIKCLNSRWSHKIWDVMKSGEGIKEKAQPKCRQRWTIRNGRRPSGQRGMGTITDPCSMRYAWWVSLGLVRQHWLCPPAFTAKNQNSEAPALPLTFHCPLWDLEESPFRKSACIYSWIGLPWWLRW